MSFLSPKWKEREGKEGKEGEKRKGRKGGRGTGAAKRQCVSYQNEVHHMLKQHFLFQLQHLFNQISPALFPSGRTGVSPRLSMASSPSASW